MAEPRRTKPLDRMWSTGAQRRPKVAVIFSAVSFFKWILQLHPLDLYPCCRSTVVRVGGRVIIRRSHAPYVSDDGPPANRCPAAIG
jgi:hypothetical protein